MISVTVTMTMTPVTMPLTCVSQFWRSQYVESTSWIFSNVQIKTKEKWPLRNLAQKMWFLMKFLNKQMLASPIAHTHTHTYTLSLSRFFHTCLYGVLFYILNISTDMKHESKCWCRVCLAWNLLDLQGLLSSIWPKRTYAHQQQPKLGHIWTIRNKFCCVCVCALSTYRTFYCHIGLKEAKKQ